MWHRNSGKSEDEILQNQFTTYLTEAVQHRRSDYLRHIAGQQRMEDMVGDMLIEPESLNEKDLFLGMPLFMQLESNALLYALKEINERERHVFLARVLDEKSFESLAEEMDLGYKGVTAIYYRTIRKIRKKMKEMRK